jgi:DNA-binding response OmpR family regulator
MSNPILIVEDDGPLREALMEALTMKGYRVVSARDAREATARLDTIVPALILLDTMIHPGNTPAFVHELERRGLRPGLPILVMTADRAGAEKAAEIGAEDYLDKPFRLEKLFEKVAALAGE